MGERLSSFCQQETHKVVSVSNEGVESALEAVAFLLQTSLEYTLYLPPLPPLGQATEQAQVHTNAHRHMPHLSCPLCLEADPLLGQVQMVLEQLAPDEVSSERVRNELRLRFYGVRECFFGLDPVTRYIHLVRPHLLFPVTALPQEGVAAQRQAREVS